LKLEEAVRIASQIASGLKAAHAKDIVHRDIKGGNIMLTAEGEAKILDFGLAQTAASTKLTRLGSTLGTVAYMSPEQARGEPVDLRSDLWSLGAVLYEMIAGRSPFPGDYEQAVVYEILNQDPEPLTAVRTGVPMGLEWIINKLLAKESKHRYQTATDLLVDLETVDLTSISMSRTSSVTTSAMRQAQNTVGVTSGLPLTSIGLLLLGLLVGLGLMWFLKPTDSSDPSSRRFIAVGADQVKGLPPNFLWTPDSKGLIYTQNPGRFVHLLLETKESRTIADFPSGNWQGWQILKDGTLATVIDQTIVGPLLAGVEPQKLAGPVAGYSRSFAQLPNDNGFIATRIDSLGTWWLAHATLNGFRDLRVIQDGSEFANDALDDRGFLLYHAPDASGVVSVWALPIDLGSVAVPGNPKMVAFSANQPTVSDEGTLLYTQIPIVDSLDVSIISTATASRRSIKINSGNGTPYNPEISPDNSRLAFVFRGGESQDIWILDQESGEHFQLTRNIEFTWRPSWSPDGSRIVFQSFEPSNGNRGDIYIQSASGFEEPEAILTGPGHDWGPIWSTDGEWILYSHQDAETDLSSIRRLRLTGNGEPELVIGDPQGAWFPSQSPDGGFIVYESLRPPTPSCLRQR